MSGSKGGIGSRQRYCQCGVVWYVGSRHDRVNYARKGKGKGGRARIHNGNYTVAVQEGVGFDGAPFRWNFRQPVESPRTVRIYWPEDSPGSLLIVCPQCRARRTAARAPLSKERRVLLTRPKYDPQAGKAKARQHRENQSKERR